MVFAVASVGVFVAFVLRAPVAAIGTYALFILLPTLVSWASDLTGYLFYSPATDSGLTEQAYSPVPANMCMAIPASWTSGWEFFVPTLHLSSFPFVPAVITWADGGAAQSFTLMPPCTDVWPALAVGVPWIVVPTLVGIFLFSRAQIR